MKRYGNCCDGVGLLFRDFCRNGLFFRESGGSFDHISFIMSYICLENKSLPIIYNVHLSKGLVNYYESLIYAFRFFSVCQLDKIYFQNCKVLDYVLGGVFFYDK